MLNVAKMNVSDQVKNDSFECMHCYRNVKVLSLGSLLPKRVVSFSIASSFNCCTA